MDNHQLAKLLGRRLKWLRKTRDLTQIQLAERVSCHASYISQIECGRFPALSMLNLIANALCVSITDMFDFSNDCRTPPTQR